MEFGPNKIPHQTSHISFKRFFTYLKDGFSILLFFASILSFLSAAPVIGGVIIGIVIINAFASVLQEVRAEKAMQALKDWIPEIAKVIRDARLQKIAVEELVPGDILSLEQGDRIPADARLVEAHDVWINNIPLTGEAEPQPRNAIAANILTNSYLEAPNLAFMSTSVVHGYGKAVVFATGIKTKFGEIANLALGISDPQSPLEKEIEVTAKKDFVLVMSLGIIFFIITILWLHLSIFSGILFMIGVMVSLVPEGLQLTVSSALAINVVQMARQNVLVKRMSAVQTLGSVTNICTDKTGTITKGEMTVRKLLAGNLIFKVSSLGYNPEGEFSFKGKTIRYGEYQILDKLVEISILCNSARVESSTKANSSTSWTIIGDPLDGALLFAAMKYGIDIEAIRKEKPLIHYTPFDSERKRVTTIHKVKNEFLLLVKGAPFDVFPACTKFVNADGSIDDFTKEYLSYLNECYQHFGQDGLRIIGCAYKELDQESYSKNQYEENDLIFVGLIAMLDPPRHEVKNAVKLAKQAGIQIVIITGDSAFTTKAIATEVGIIEKGDERLLRGRDIDKMSDQEIVEHVHTGNQIFARVSPQEKYRIVKSLKDFGEVVAVTGDGANDAPSLKVANIGVSMGLSGTDIARESSDIVLLDDNFASIVKAVESGRAIYDNIRRFIVYVFSHNWAELIPFFLYAFLRIPLPLLVMQILAIDLAIDIIPSLAISREPAEQGIMNNPPRSLKEHLFDSHVLFRSLYVGTIIAVGAIIGCLSAWISGGWDWGETLDPSSLVYIKGTTMTFAGIVMGQVGNVFSSRTNKVSIFRLGFSRNKWILRGIAAQVGILFVLIYVPWLQPIFSTTALNALDWIYLLLIMISVISAEEIRKLIIRIWKK